MSEVQEISKSSRENCMFCESVKKTMHSFSYKNQNLTSIAGDCEFLRKI